MCMCMYVARQIPEDMYVESKGIFKNIKSKVCVSISLEDDFDDRRGRRPSKLASIL